ncbi:MAG TPA: hypothetical protein DEP13_04765 [Gammaproteobacteria bacterium]|nr:hypothetical protein [Gammaproteobacteria bacterium]
MSIPDIEFAKSSISDISLYTPPVQVRLFIPQLPHGVSMALPIVQVPGCVEAHVDSALQTGLTVNDPDRVAIYCDSGIPSYDAMSFQPNNWQPVSRKGIPNTGGLGEELTKEDTIVQPPLVPELEFLPSSVSTAVLRERSSRSKPNCQQGEIIVSGECTTPIQPTINIESAVGKYLPSLEAATTTATIATVATVSALAAKPAADFLLKLIKPMVKKIINKIKKALGKKVKAQSLRERVLAQRARNQLLRQARDLMG